MMQLVDQVSLSSESASVSGRCASRFLLVLRTLKRDFRTESSSACSLMGDVVRRIDAYFICRDAR